MHCKVEADAKRILLLEATRDVLFETGKILLTFKHDEILELFFTKWKSLELFQLNKFFPIGFCVRVFVISELCFS